MDNQVVFAAAGNGKTYSLCTNAKNAKNKSEKYILMISYTNEGIHSLKCEYKKQNNGILDDRVVFKSWYSFLLSEFIKPYQCTLKLKVKSYKVEHPVTIPENYISSIAFYDQNPPAKWFNKSHVQYFINKNRDVIPDRTSHLAHMCNEHSHGKSISRLEDIYSHIFIDELQDYAGWDLEIIRLLFNSKISVSCVGDYKQATYRTNNSPKNCQYRDEKVRCFFEELEKKKLCACSWSNTTRRFNDSICKFVNTIYDDSTSNIMPNPLIEKRTNPDHIGVYLIDNRYLQEYCDYYHPVILRYDKRAKISFDHHCDIFNYGGSKGATFDRVVIIPVNTVLSFLKKQLKIEANQTRAKFYVASTRARHSIVFAIDFPEENKLFKPCELAINGKVIPGFKFNNE